MQKDVSLPLKWFVYSKTRSHQKSLSKETELWGVVFCNIDNAPAWDLVESSQVFEELSQSYFLRPTKRLIVHRPWKMKIKDIKKLLGIRAGESDIKPGLLFMMSFSFYGGSRGWKLKADMGSRFLDNLPYTTVHKSAPLISGIMLLLTRASLSFWKVITVQGSPTKHLWMSFLP